MFKNRLLMDHLEGKLKAIIPLNRTAIPPIGWIKTVRMGLGMSLQQLGTKLSVTRQSVQELEKRESDGSITLRSLRDAANAMDMELVYGFVPKDGDVQSMVNRKARELATKIVQRTSQSMLLEDQANQKERLEKAIDELTYDLKRELPKALWD